MPTKLKNRTEKTWNHVVTFFSKPANVMLVIFGITLTVLTLIPLISILREMFIVHVGIEKTMTGLKKGEFTLYHWKKLFFDTGEWSKVTFWEPFLNSFMVGLGGATLGIAIGGTVAWLLARSNLKCKNIITSLFMVIDDRDFITLLGPSGCGKTTTLRMIAGLESSVRIPLPVTVMSSVW